MTDRRAYDPFAPAPPAAGPAPAPPAQAERQPLPGNLDDLRKPELVALAEQRGVDSSGTRVEIIARLRAAAG